MKHGGLLLAALATTAFGAVWAIAGTVNVTPSNMNGWAFQTRDGATLSTTGNAGDITQMTTGPATPPLGTGSAELGTASGHGDDNARIGTNSYNGILLSTITSLSYDTYSAENNGQQYPYLRIYVSEAGDGSNPTGEALFFEPPYQTPSTGNSSLPNQGATAMDTWQGWNALTGAWWDNDNIMAPGAAASHPGNPINSLAYYISQHPDATVLGIYFEVGEASPTDNFLGYVDDFTIGTAAGTTTYNFDPNGAAVPLPASAWSGLALLGALGLFGAFKRHRKQIA